MDLTKANKLKIQSNRREIFELETQINSNKAQVYATRAVIEQNYTSIMRNYSSTFLGNHNLTTQNTDNLFRNRVAILTNMEVEGEVEINFQESMTNEANLDFLEMQATVNELVLEINNRMSEINSLMIETNKMIMNANQASVDFNSKNLAINKRFLNGEFHPSKATSIANKQRADKNQKRCGTIRDIANKNAKKLKSLDKKAKKNSMQVLLNAADISKRRGLISDNQKGIMENQEEVARMISSKIKRKG
ncbi:MAG: hypothetical protein CML40_05170 [Rhodobacteraceae bacterium]|nr:MAG: hypothetical protein CML40_05170 [Paracoccaceae bacterium]